MKLKLLAVAAFTIAAAAPSYAIMPIEMPKNADGSARFADDDDNPFANSASGPVLGAAEGGSYFGAYQYDAPREASPIKRERSAWGEAYSAITSEDFSARKSVDCVDCAAPPLTTADQH